MDATARSFAPKPVDYPPSIVPRSAGAAWHHNLETVDLAALEELYQLLDALRPNVAIYGELRVELMPRADRRALERGVDAALRTIYRRLLVDGGRAIFASDNLVPAVELVIDNDAIGDDAPAGAGDDVEAYRG